MITVRSVITSNRVRESNHEIGSKNSEYNFKRCKLGKKRVASEADNVAPSVQPSVVNAGIRERCAKASMSKVV